MNKANFSVQLYDLEEAKPYSKGKCRIFYVGLNRNGSHISQECADYMAQNIAYTPVIGEYIESIDNFGGHGGKIIVDSKGVQYIDTTKPYGCAMDSDIWYENVVEEDGTSHDYMCCNVALWDKRYPELKTIIESGSHQSMEIEIVDGEFKDGVYYIKKANFLGLCILGKDDENAENDTEPCFESSSIDVQDYSLNKKDFIEEFNLMLKEMKLNTQNQSSQQVDNIKFSNIEEGGNENLNEKLELLAKYNLTIEQLDFNIEELSLEDLETKLQEFSNNKNDENQELSFSATYRQKRDALRNALDPKIEKDSDGNITYEEYFYVEDFDDEFLYVEKTIWTPDYECKYGRYTYTFDETTLTATLTSEFEEMILTWLTLEENQKIQDERNQLEQNFELLQNEFAEYKEKYTTTNEEVVRLQEFESKILKEQRENDETAIFEQFEEQLNGVEEFEMLKENKSNYELDELEKECFVILGKKNSTASFSNKNKKNEKVKIPFSKNQENHWEFEEIFEKYKDKN